MLTKEELKEQGFTPIMYLPQLHNGNIYGASLYYIKDDSTIYSTRSKRFLKPQVHNLGYRQVYLTYWNGGGQWHKIHRLMAMHFIPNPSGLSDVNHKDGNKANNNIENLEWLSHRDNILHSYRVLGRVHDGSYTGKKIKCSNGKTYASAVEASKATDCATSNISACCNGKMKGTKGFTFSFVI